MKKNTHIIILLVVLFMLFSHAIKAVDPDVWYRTTGEKTTPKTESSSSSAAESSSSCSSSSSSYSSSTELKGTGTGGSSDLNLDALEKEINNVQGTDTTDAVNKVLGVASIFIVSAAVIVVIMKGVSFMQAAPEGKAEIQKQMINIVVGGVILFGINGIVGIIINAASKMF